MITFVYSRACERLPPVWCSCDCMLIYCRSFESFRVLPKSFNTTVLCRTSANSVRVDGRGEGEGGREEKEVPFPLLTGATPTDGTRRFHSSHGSVPPGNRSHHHHRLRCVRKCVAFFFASFSALLFFCWLIALLLLHFKHSNGWMLLLRLQPLRLQASPCELHSFAPKAR